MTDKQEETFARQRSDHDTIREQRKENERRKGKRKRKREREKSNGNENEEIRSAIR